MKNKLHAALESDALWLVVRFLLCSILLLQGFTVAAAAMDCGANVCPLSVGNMLVAAAAFLSAVLVMLSRLIWLAALTFGVISLFTLLDLTGAEKAFPSFAALSAAAIAGHFHRCLKDW